MSETQNIGELIPVSENNGRRAVSARDLYKYLGVRKDFTSWMKAQIARCDLVELVDYQAFTQKVEASNGIGFTTKNEYALTLDAAKEVSMMSQTEKGKQARRYFIECERIATEKKPLSQLEALQQSVNALVEQEHRLKAVEQRLDNLDKEREENGRKLLEVRLSSERAPEITMRDRVNELVRKYAGASNTSYQEVWHMVYNKLLYLYHISINSYKKLSPKESKLDVAERNGLLGKIYTIISEIIRDFNNNNTNLIPVTL